MHVSVNACLSIYIGETILASLAQKRGFSARDVPRDGNCLFSAVVVELDKLGIQPGEMSQREQFVEYLQEHPYTHDASSHFREYIPAPVVSEDCMQMPGVIIIYQFRDWLTCSTSTSI